MVFADQGAALLSGGTTGGVIGATGGSGGAGATGALPSTVVHSLIAEASFATMLKRCRSLSVVCCSV